MSNPYEAAFNRTAFEDPLSTAESELNAFATISDNDPDDRMLEIGRNFVTLYDNVEPDSVRHQVLCDTMILRTYESGNPIEGRRVQLLQEIGGVAVFGSEYHLARAQLASTITMVEEDVAYRLGGGIILPGTHSIEDVRVRTPMLLRAAFLYVAERSAALGLNHNNTAAE